MLQAGRSPVQIPDEVDFFNLRNPSSITMALGSTQPLTEMSTRNFHGDKNGRRVGLTTLPPFMSRMSENVGASISCNPKGLHGLYGDNFTLPYLLIEQCCINKFGGVASTTEVRSGKLLFQNEPYRECYGQNCICLSVRQLRDVTTYQADCTGPVQSDSSVLSRYSLRQGQTIHSSEVENPNKTNGMRRNEHFLVRRIVFENFSESFLWVSSSI
jgi:hypothetical protein